MALIRYLTAVIAASLLIACSPPSAENPYRKDSRFTGGLNVPVVFLVSEWAGNPNIMASGWLMEGGNGILFSAKHFTDAFMGDIVELGGSECKAFINNRVYTCLIVQVPALRDAVVLRLQGSLSSGDLPVPYKISTEKVKVGEKLFVQGFHPHPLEVMQSNKADGFEDLVIPILRDFYERRIADPLMQKEIVFDSLGGTVVSVNEKIKVEEQNHEFLGDLKHRANEYITIKMDRNHKFSFGGLSGGVALRINSQGEHEAVGIITAERIVRNPDKKVQPKDKSEPMAIADTLMITPILSVQDLYRDPSKLR